MSAVECTKFHIPDGWMCIDPDVPEVIVATGRRSRLVFWLGSAAGIDALDVDPIERAMIVAQLRAIADRLDGDAA